MRLFRRSALWALCALAALFCLAACSARAESLCVRICLSEDLPGNQPYRLDDREYRRNIATPLLDGARGFIYKKTTQVNTWLFPVTFIQGTPTLRLSLADIKDPTSISINDTLLSADSYVEVPLSEAATLRVANAKYRGVMRLMFTNLPVIELRPQGKVYQDRDTPCGITVFDPDYRAHGLSAATTEYEGVMSRRGRSSARYAAKHPYNFSLMQDGKKADHSLLGLRVDSDWLLDSAYNDASRMRNRVLMDVWHEIYRLPWDRTLSGATRGVYVELFLNGAYRGLYALGEKQDRHQMGLASPGGKWNSVFFRTGETGRDGASPAGFLSLGKEKPVDDDPLRWYNVQLRYPTDRLQDAEALWADFYDLVRLVVKGSPEEFAARITQYVDLDNLARYWLFCNATDITDNMRKNMTFVRLDDRDERFNRFILLPWDMDASLGRYYSSKKSRVEEAVSNRLFDRLMAENPCGYLTILRDDWASLREGALSTDAIMARFEAYYSVIRMSGADQRETDKFPTFTSYVRAHYSFDLNFEKELAYIRSYTEKRLAWLDGFVQSLE